MPTYQYACTDPACDHRFEQFQSFTDAALTECPVCSSRLRKVYGSVGVVFKGSGFYRNDSRAETNGTKRKQSEKDHGKSSESSSDSGTASSSDSSSASKDRGSDRPSSDSKDSSSAAKSSEATSTKPATQSSTTSKGSRTPGA